MAPPFLYLCSLRRTGSTVLAEALTHWPDAFVFREPALATGTFRVKADDADLWQEHGVDLRRFAKEHEGAPERLVAAFRDELLPRLLEHVKQVGVKEIRHDGWRALHRLFPAMKVLLTGRDPRDVYVSLFHRVQERGGQGWSGPFTPEAVAADLAVQFQHQRAMLEETAALKVRYEDLCAGEAVFTRVKEFAGSPIEAMGEVGAFNAGNRWRRGESELHDGRLTALRVGRFRKEEDPRLRAEAERMIELMPEYCAFWGYSLDSRSSTTSAFPAE